MVGMENLKSFEEKEGKPGEEGQTKEAGKQGQVAERAWLGRGLGHRRAL